ncbi:MAG TPA: UDP-glucose 4-epimerase GalE, partial [Spirochaetia bacterium]|nr:UDP-glucose 4-epimerase GalE [Spirochaetia bacterium]
MFYKGKKVLVTGGAGYIGSIAVKGLLENNFSVVIVDTLENGHQTAVDSRAKLEIADIGDQARITAVINQYQPVAVIDFAAYLAVGESMEKPEKY